MSSNSPNAHYFTASPSWKALIDASPSFQQYLAKPFSPKDVVADRAHQLVEEGEWASKHSPETYGYDARVQNFKVRDGAEILIKIYKPLDRSQHADARLPILFVVHGGGFIQGTGVTEERWLVAPLLARLNEFGERMVVVNVEFRRAPENPYPGPLQDCEDVLRSLLADPTSTLGAEYGSIADTKRVYLAGSSAGSCLVALLSQFARDEGLGAHIEGVALNVPVLCHQNYFPQKQFPWASSYKEAAKVGSTLLTIPHMEEVWQLYLPTALSSEEQQRAAQRASPLLQSLNDLPPHALFIAGQDALRDEGLAYAQKLAEAGVRVDVKVYPGVPHIFGEFWDMPEAQSYQQDLAAWVLRRLREVQQR